jgi:hypothetical protein
MTHAAEAASALRAAAISKNPDVKTAAAFYGTAFSALVKADDLIDVAKAAAVLALAAEHLAAQAGAVLSACRTGLATAMDETGMPNISIGSHVVGLIYPAPPIRITDRAAIPPQYWTTPKQPEPEPDMVLLRRALKNGPVPGAELGNIGAPSVAFRPRKERAA